MSTLDTAPAEVLHAVCALLSPKDVAALRTTCLVLADIGANYLVRQIRFHTSQLSIDRLQAFADHNVFSQYIETVHFEANLLANISCRNSWLELFQKPGHDARDLKLEMPNPPKSPVSVRENRLYLRNYKKWQGLVDEKYQQFRASYEDQQELLQHGPELMADIMPKFPRLQKVIFAFGRCSHALSFRFLKEFSQGLGCAPLSVDTAPTSSQLRHIIAPAGIPLPNLQTLIVSDLDPALFISTEAASTVRQAFVNLKKLDISFRLPDKDEPTTDPGLYRVFRKGALRDVLSSAFKLEELRIAFHDFTYDGPCAELKNVLGGISFDHLHRLSLSYIEASAKDFIESLKQQKVLKSLDISCVSIVGSWVDVLAKMKRELKLDAVDFEGFLTDDERMYDMGNADVDHFMDCGEAFSIATAMEMFITDGFNDEDYPNPLENFEEEFADPETLEEMYHEMIAEVGDDCDCANCVAEREEFDESMPDLEGNEDSDC